MPNNILSDDAMSALTFDPFEAQGNDGGFIEPAGQESPGTQQPAPQQPQQTQPQQPAPVAGQPQAPAPTGRTLPNDNPAPVAGQPQQQAPGQPAPNSVAAFMESMRTTGAPPPGMPQMPQAPQNFQPQVPQHQQLPQPQQPQGQQPQERAPVDYSKPYVPAPVQVPQQFMAAIFGEDPQQAAQAMNTLVGTLYNSIMQEVHGQMGLMHQQVQQMPQTATQHFQQEQARQRLHDTFYGRHPDLNTPFAKNYVGSISQSVYATYAQQGIPVDVNSHEFIDYVAQQARQAMGMAPRQQGQGVPQQQTPAPTNQPRRQFQTGSATRAGGSSNPFADALGVSFG